MAKYPGAAIFTNVVAHAAKHDRHVDEVYADYLAHRRSYELIWTYENWQALEEKRAAEEAGKKPSTGAPGRLGR